MVYAYTCVFFVFCTFMCEYVNMCEYVEYIYMSVWVCVIQVGGCVIQGWCVIQICVCVCVIQIGGWVSGCVLFRLVGGVVCYSDWWWVVCYSNVVYKPWPMTRECIMKLTNKIFSVWNKYIECIYVCIYICIYICM